MKTVKALAMTVVLALSLSIPVFADTNPGDDHSPGRSDPVTKDAENPTTELPNTGTTGDSDLGFTTIADILWGLASIY
jgi:hypothetical protein